jgi:hypothetical protein
MASIDAVVWASFNACTFSVYMRLASARAVAPPPASRTRRRAITARASNPNSAACDDKANHALHIRITFKSGAGADAQSARASDSVSNVVCAVVAPRDGLWVAAGWPAQGRCGGRATGRHECAPPRNTAPDLRGHIIQRGSQNLFTACAPVLIVSAKQLLECARRFRLRRPSRCIPGRVAGLVVQPAGRRHHSRDCETVMPAADP